MAVRPVRFAAFGCAMLALGACATLRSPPGVWDLQASATTGAALVFSERGQAALRLACRRSPTELYLASDRLKPAAGEVRLSVDGHLFRLQGLAGEPRLAAVGPMPDDLPAALMAGGRVGIAGASGRLAGLPAPDGKTAAAFVIACRAAGEPR